MGQGKRKRGAFFAEHPTCIFCGGGRPADTEDHVPGRTFFRGRAWPINHVFPACSACNAATRPDEQILSFVARMGQRNASDADRSEWLRAMRGVANNHEELYRELRMRPNELRRALEAYGLDRIPGLPLDQHPFVKLPADTFRPAIMRYGFKIGAALHYLHTQRIVAQHGGCFVELRTNLDVATGGLPDELVAMLPARPALTRSGKSLNDQFSYAYGVTDCAQAGAYLVHFRGTFALFIIVGVTSAAMARAMGNDEDAEGRIVHPFAHPAQ